MQYKVTINGKTYTVEIEDINARPVVAYVDGQKVEVTPENGIRSEVQKEAKEFGPLKFPARGLDANVKELVAPLPGTVIEVFFKAGDEIEAGETLLIIEAMKMKNSIRATRGGRIAEVLVQAGETVAHKQTLARFE